MIEILSTALPNSIQDLGRPGLLSSGVSGSGAMDRRALAVANLLLGNEAEAAGIEIALFPFRVRARIDTGVAVTGADLAFTIDGASYPSWWACPLRAGQTLVIQAPRRGARAYLAFAGGIDVPLVLGSRSTDLKGEFGGFAGRGLKRGDLLALAPLQTDAKQVPAGGFGAALPETVPYEEDGTIALRVIAAAEFAAFEPAARRDLYAAEWIVTAEANRMGYRLSGPKLALTRPLELLSHGIVPGTVQVPPAGQPIVQLSEANTCGGYPKIATVIDADLWKLGQAPVGARLRLRDVGHAEAVGALRRQRDRMEELRGTLALLR